MITCPRCGMTSSNPTDEAQGYCGNCHDWTQPAGWTRQHTQEVTAERQIWNAERADQRFARALARGEHLWVAAVAYAIDEPPINAGTLLDADSMMFPPAIGCFICEEDWSPRMAHRRCKGEPPT